MIRKATQEDRRSELSSTLNRAIGLHNTCDNLLVLAYPMAASYFNENKGFDLVLAKKLFYACTELYTFVIDNIETIANELGVSSRTIGLELRDAALKMEEIMDYSASGSKTDWGRIVRACDYLQGSVHFMLKKFLDVSSKREKKQQKSASFLGIDTIEELLQR